MCQEIIPHVQQTSHQNCCQAQALFKTIVLINSVELLLLRGRNSRWNWLDIFIPFPGSMSCAQTLQRRWCSASTRCPGCSAWAPGTLPRPTSPFSTATSTSICPPRPTGSASILRWVGIWFYLCTTLLLSLHRFPITKPKMIKTKYDLHALLKTEIRNLFTNIYGT